MTIHLRSALVLGLMLLLVSGDQLPAGDQTPQTAKHNSAEASKPAAEKPLITVSKETTVLTEPLRPDGYVDYVAAMNDRAKQGVTPQNNAAVLFWQAVGPGAIPPELRERFFKVLDMTPPPEDGEYFQSFEDYARGHVDKAKREATGFEESLFQTMNRFERRPWNAAEAPLLASWLDANAKALDLIVAASKRPRHVTPYVSSSGELMDVNFIPELTPLRDALQALLIRGNLRIAEGRVDKAWEDFLAIRRWARHQSAGDRTLIENLIAGGFDLYAHMGEEALFRSEKLTAARALEMRGEVARFGLPMNAAHGFETSDRWKFCDAVGAIARHGIDAKRPHGLAMNSQTWLANGARASIDWNAILRKGNGWYDRMVAVGRETRSDRLRAASAIDRDLWQLKKELDQPLRGLTDLATSHVSDALGDRLVVWMLSANSAVYVGESRAQQLWEIDQLGFALAAYHADNSNYPKSLAALTPKYVDKIPDDIFSRGDLIYRIVEGGYMLYSVGLNGKDDGGPDDPDRPVDFNREPSDDIGLRVTKPK